MVAGIRSSTKGKFSDFPIIEVVLTYVCRGYPTTGPASTILPSVDASPVEKSMGLLVELPFAQVE